MGTLLLDSIEAGMRAPTGTLDLVHAPTVITRETLNTVSLGKPALDFKKKRKRIVGEAYLALRTTRRPWVEQPSRNDVAHREGDDEIFQIVAFERSLMAGQLRDRHRRPSHGVPPSRKRRSSRPLSTITAAVRQATRIVAPQPTPGLDGRIVPPELIT